MEKPIVIQVTNLSKSYNGIQILDDISFNIYKGEVVGLAGINGAGKSTLIESIEGLRKIESGSITVLGKSIDKHYKSVQQEIGVQLQRTSLIGNITLDETLTLFKTLYNVKTNNSVLLERVSLADAAHKKVKHLSGGQYQRFNLCLAILNDPKILFLDEPTTGLDPIARRELWTIINDLKKLGVTILVTTHYLDEAQEICDKILILGNKKIVVYDTPHNLIKKLENEKTIIMSGIEMLSQTDLEELNNRFKIKYTEEKIFIYTYDIGKTLNEFFEWTKHNQRIISDVSVRSSNLEDVFMMYTAAVMNKKNEIA
ncbi:MAG: ABC transporter ATP-binding protein [Chryseobacterium sp.]|uniref:ABC transporter ATP-binding protein n=1 Tax=Chryseobacterium sp. TaxID=1871047 RepID=UPI0025BE0645|nr:ABC transporter ATP-binding protein [Chryseobacterium sp.]MCJ7934774.1 ABC transporter ATP-binding protein [Chryseobacterium sp.]